MVTLLHYGCGNIQACANIYKRLGIPTQIAATAEDLRGATKLVLPGVGAFDWAMGKLNASGMRDALDELVLGQKTPVLGICVGMQMLARESEEGRLPGLGWIDARVSRFTSADSRMSLPHMGWNDVTPRHDVPLFRSLVHPRFYFLHSYRVEVADASDVLAVADYHGEFPAAMGRGHVFGVQFHPEKSHQWGVGLMQAFAEL